MGWTFDERSESRRLSRSWTDSRGMTSQEEGVSTPRVKMGSCGRLEKRAAGAVSWLRGGRDGCQREVSKNWRCFEWWAHPASSKDSLE